MKTWLPPWPSPPRPRPSAKRRRKRARPGRRRSEAHGSEAHGWPSVGFADHLPRLHHFFSRLRVCVLRGECFMLRPVNAFLGGEDQLGEDAAGLDEVVIGADLDDLAVVENED